MASESRQLSTSNITRMAALDAAVLKDTAMGVSSFLTTATKTRLVAIQPLYRTAYDATGPAKVTLSQRTTEKDVALGRSRMFASHMVQVLNLAIERGVFAASVRAFYKLDVNSGVLPTLDNEAQVIEFVKDVIKGETDRIAAGGAALAFPTLAQVAAENTALQALLSTHTTAADAYDAALEAVDGHNNEADKVIKKVWDEVETFYNEEDESSKRENAREWGVVYITVGSSKTVTGTVTDSVTLAPVAGATIYFANGNKTAVSDAQGHYTLTTTLMGDQQLLAEADLYNNYDKEVTLVENENLVQDIEMEKIV